MVRRKHMSRHDRKDAQVQVFVGRMHKSRYGKKEAHVQA
jgi:hypothetical protein